MKIKKMKVSKKSGVAIVMVIGLIAIMIPVIIMLSQMGTSQTRLAMKYHENLLTETTAFSGNNAIVSRLRGNLRGFQYLPDQPAGDKTYSICLRPTGKGFFQQTLYYTFSSCRINNHNYIIMAEAEQFQPQPAPPVMVITRDHWNTIEPYELNLMSDVLSMQNERGVALLRLDETREYEMNATAENYSAAMQDKQIKLPDEIQAVWPDVVETLTSEKLM